MKFDKLVESIMKETYKKNLKKVLDAPSPSEFIESLPKEKQKEFHKQINKGIKKVINKKKLEES